MESIYEIGNFVVKQSGSWFNVWNKHGDFMGAEKYKYQAIQLAVKLHARSK